MARRRAPEERGYRIVRTGTPDLDRQVAALRILLLAPDADKPHQDTRPTPTGTEGR